MIGLVVASATLAGCAVYTVRLWARALREREPNGERGNHLPVALPSTCWDASSRSRSTRTFAEAVRPYECRYVTPHGVDLPLAHGWPDKDVLVTIAEIEAL